MEKYIPIDENNQDDFIEIFEKVGITIDEAKAKSKKIKNILDSFNKTKTQIENETIIFETKANILLETHNQLIDETMDIVNEMIRLNNVDLTNMEEKKTEIMKIIETEKKNHNAKAEIIRDIDLQAKSMTICIR